jgi:threonine dehydrogenase-like Zn-dependent dehydrogenase
MRALRFDDTLTLSKDEPNPIAAPGEALITLRAAGICHTDLELTRGYMDYRGILGHEFVGEVATDAHSPDGSISARTRVVGEINIACGKCEFCYKGIPSQCSNRSTLGIAQYPGVFADYLRLPIRNLHAIPDSVSDEEAVFTEPLAAAYQVTELVHLRPSDRVIVIGAGKLGLLIAQVLKKTGCDLSVVVRQDRPRDLLKKWNIDAVDIRQRRILPGSADVVVDCTGSAEGFASALNMVKPRGTVVLKSTYASLPHADLTKVVVDEIHIIGSRCGNFPAALRMLAAGEIDVQSMIDARYTLNEALTAFEHAARPGTLKVLLTR